LEIVGPEGVRLLEPLTRVNDARLRSLPRPSKSPAPQCIKVSRLRDRRSCRRAYCLARRDSQPSPNVRRLLHLTPAADSNRTTASGLDFEPAGAREAAMRRSGRRTSAVVGDAVCSNTGRRWLGPDEKKTRRPARRRRRRRPRATSEGVQDAHDVRGMCVSRRGAVRHRAARRPNGPANGHRDRSDSVPRECDQYRPPLGCDAAATP